MPESIYVHDKGILRRVHQTHQILDYRLQATFLLLLGNKNLLTVIFFKFLKKEELITMKNRIKEIITRFKPLNKDGKKSKKITIGFRIVKYTVFAFLLLFSYAAGYGYMSVSYGDEILSFDEVDQIVEDKVEEANQAVDKVEELEKQITDKQKELADLGSEMDQYLSLIHI